MKSKGFLSYFSQMKDPRINRTKFHHIDDILFISIAAVLSGAETWNEIEYYGKMKQSWLKTFLKLPNGIPSHDTFNRFFSILDGDEFEKCFLEWIKSLQKSTNGEIVSLDGKTIRGSRNQNCKSATHIVSAWADKNELILGQIKVDEKSNEITAIPKLLDALMIEGSVITIDAMGCQKNIAKKIIDKGADYILAVKDNHKQLCEDIKDSFRVLKPSDSFKDVDYGHGRIEKRECSIIADLSLIENCKKWTGLVAIVKIDRERTFKASNKVEQETSYYISSLSNAKTIGKGIGSHWGIENKVHWVLDVAFNEDHSRKRAGNAAQNFSNLNRISINLLKKDDAKLGIKGKRKMIGWNDEYIFKLLEN
jgi:predicted transposase YbfD/YdcC